jgi:cytochrome c-type biogenesis protein CcmH/NrfF
LISRRLVSRRGLVRVSQLALLCTVITVTMGATDSTARFNKDSHQLMCGCSCNQLLGECNHVGCPVSPVMLAQLSARIAKGDSDESIFHQFQDEYGAVILASPMFTRFNHLAWIMPPLVLFLGIACVLLIVRNWKLRTVPMPATPDTPGFAATRDRIRRETQL